MGRICYYTRVVVPRKNFLDWVKRRPRPMHGIYAILATFPIWATAAILFTVTMATILVGRDVFEGLPYNVAYSAVIGDAGLVIGVLGATILQRGGTYIPSWLQVGEYQGLVASGGVVVCSIICRLTINSRSGQAVDFINQGRFRFRPKMLN